MALITGAQSNSSAVGLSAPNAMLSRETFSPMITEEQLNTLTLNIVPARDVVPMLDDKARLFQNINCTAAQNENSCHGSLRSLCEIQYTCGSGSRPVPCECALKYKYPEPLSTDQTNFTQACLDVKNMY